MLFRRAAPLAAFVLVQLIIIADELNDRQLDPLDTDTHWTGEFAVLIACLVAVFVFILVTFVQAGRWWFNEARDGAPATDDAEVSLDGSPAAAQKYGGAQRLVAPSINRRMARVYFWNAVIDLALLIPAAVFLGLLIDQLFRRDDAVVGNEYAWSVVLIPLEVMLGLVAIVLLFAAWRVCGEATYQRSLGNTEYMSAALAGVIVCCPTDADYAAQAEWQEREKRVDYIADGAYHELPCVFVFTPGMTYGAADLLLAWFLFAFLIALPLTLVFVGLRLDDRTDASLDTIFAGLYTLEGLLIATAIALLLTLCLWRNAGNQRPAGRRSLEAKFYEAILVIISSALFIAQQALLAAHDAPEDSWFVTFIPIFLFLSLLVIIGCCELSCGRPGRRALDGKTPVVVDATNPRGIRSTGARPKTSGLAGAKPVSVHHKSAWGAFQ